MVRLKNKRILLDYDLRYLNFRISKDCYDIKKFSNLIEKKICKSILDFGIYIFLKKIIK